MSLIVNQASVPRSAEESQSRSSCSFRRCLQVAKCVLILTLAWVGSKGMYGNYENHEQSKEPYLQPNFYATVRVQEIAKELGSPYPGQFNVVNDENLEEDQAYASSSTIHIGSGIARALRRTLPRGALSTEEAEGLLGHEIGHITKGHTDPANPVFEHWKSCEFAEDTTTKPRCWMDVSYENEKEADLFTLGSIRLAKGLLSFFHRISSSASSMMMYEGPGHPRFSERIRYLAKALCKNRENN